MRFFFWQYLRTHMLGVRCRRGISTPRRQTRPQRLRGPVRGHGHDPNEQRRGLSNLRNDYRCRYAFSQCDIFRYRNIVRLIDIDRPIDLLIDRYTDR